MFERKLTKANNPSTFPLYPHSNYWATSMEENNKVPYGPIRNEAVQKSANENLRKCLKCFHQWEVNGLFTNNILLPVVLSSGQFWIWTKFILFLYFFTVLNFLKFSWIFKVKIKNINMAISILLHRLLLSFFLYGDTALHLSS